MRFVISREELLTPLQIVVGAVERRQTMPILANVHLQIKNDTLSMTCTDLEVELVSEYSLQGNSYSHGAVTIPARKFLDICRVLPEKATLDFHQDDKGRAIIRSECSRFALSTLPAEDFPSVEWEDADVIAKFDITQADLRKLLESTQFAMAQQDVRYYLNGLLLEIKDGMVWAAATDGHRLALNGCASQVIDTSLTRIITPRKGIIELLRLLNDGDDKLTVVISNNHIRLIGQRFVFTSKLIDAKFPDYERAIPRGGNKKIVVSRDALRNALSRVAVLSSDMFKGVQVHITNNNIKISSSGYLEEAEEQLQLEYAGDDFTAGFNVSYLIDALNHIDSNMVLMTLKDAVSSVLIEEYEQSGSNKVYVIMPLRI